MKPILLMLFITLGGVVYMGAATAVLAPAPASVAVITLSKYQIAIENGVDGGPSTTYSVYTITAAPALNSAGVPVTNVPAATAYGYAQAQGFVP